MNKGIAKFGYIMLNDEGMNLVNTKHAGPYPVIDTDYHFGCEILDHRNISHWIMKGNYTEMDTPTIQKPITILPTVEELAMVSKALNILAGLSPDEKEVLRVQIERGSQ